MIDFELQRKVMQNPFDIDTHKRTFKNYLEICLDPDGIPHYAVPSHRDWLESYACRVLGCTRSELLDRCPREMYLDYLTWLLKVTGCIAVWDRYFLGDANEKQIERLIQLQRHNLFLGDVVEDGGELFRSKVSPP